MSSFHTRVFVTLMFLKCMTKIGTTRWIQLCSTLHYTTDDINCTQHLSQ